MSQCDDARAFHRPLPERGKIQPQAFTDTTLCIFNFAVYLVGGQVDKFCGKVREQLFENQPFFQVLFGLFPLFNLSAQFFTGIKSLLHFKIPAY